MLNECYYAYNHAARCLSLAMYQEIKSVLLQFKTSLLRERKKEEKKRIQSSMKALKKRIPL